MRVAFELNGQPWAGDVADRTTLADLLRDRIRLTGTHLGCEQGVCGACTVLVDGQRVRSCVTRVGTVAGKKVRTVEGLAAGEKLHPVQEAFLACDAMQCGYCTPGMIMSAVALLEAHPEPRREDVALLMNGNICRCGTYTRIVAAVELAAKAAKGGAK